MNICPCGIRYDGPGSICPKCVCRDERDLREADKILADLAAREKECRPPNEAALRGCG